MKNKCIDLMENLLKNVHLLEDSIIRNSSFLPFPQYQFRYNLLKKILILILG